MERKEETEEEEKERFDGEVDVVFECKVEGVCVDSGDNDEDEDEPIEIVLLCELLV